MNNQPQHLHPAVLAACQKLEQAKSPDGLTLEEVMMCFYYRPCRRVTPGNEVKFKKYGRGSVLVYKDEVVLILFPEDNTLSFSRNRSRFIGPKRRYTGVEPQSRIYTNGQVLVYVLEPFQEVSDARRIFTELGDNPGGGFFASNSAGQLNDHRCPEGFGLCGRLSAERLMQALGKTP